MSYPSKRNGYRNIKVDGVAYRWRFDTETPDSMVILQNGTRSAQQAMVIFSHIPVWWQQSADPSSRAPGITPRHVASLVRLALAQGWTPEGPAGSWYWFEVNWKEFSGRIEAPPQAGEASRE